MRAKLIWTNCKRKLGELKEWEHNPATIGKAEAKRLLQSLEEFDQVQAIAIDADNVIVDGHQRKAVWAAAKKYGPDYEVDCRQASRKLTEKERQKLSVFLRSGTVGHYDWDVLSGWDVSDLQAWGMNSGQLNAWREDVSALSAMLEAAKPTVDAEPQIDRAAELLEKWQVKTGDLWQIGEHRLLCGDSTKREDVERVMGGEKAQLVMADPPYNVNYTGGSTNEDKRDDSYKDEWTDEEYSEWLCSILKNGSDASDDKSALMLWFASAKMRAIMDGYERAGWTARTLIVWNKTKAHYGALGAQYKHKFEPVWYCFKPGKSPRFYGATNETTVWDIDQPRVNDLHPTMKPVELYARCIGNHAEKGDAVLELFGGSGTTMVASQNLGMRARLIEKMPEFVSVILERMATAFPDLTIKKVT